MCNAKSNGGRRCASHARQDFQKAQTQFHKEPTGDNRAVLYAAQQNFEFTRTGIKQMREEGRVLEADAAQRLQELRSRVSFLENTNQTPEAWERSCRGDFVEAKKELAGLEIKFKHARTIEERKALNAQIGVSQKKIEKAWENLSEAQKLNDTMRDYGTSSKPEPPLPSPLPAEKTAAMWNEFRAYDAARRRYEPIHLTALMKKLHSGEGVTQDEYVYYAHWLKTDPTASAIMFSGRGAIHPETISKAAKTFKHDEAALSAILSNPATRSDDLNTYREHPSDKVRSTIASHRNLSARASRHLMLDQSQQVKQRLASNPATAPETLNEMVWHPAYQQAVLANRSTDTRTLAQVAGSRTLSFSSAVAVAQHPMATPEVTKALLRRFEGQQRAVLARTVAQRTTGRDLLERFALSNDPVLRAKVAGNKASGFQVLSTLSEDKHPEVAGTARKSLMNLAS